MSDKFIFEVGMKRLEEIVKILEKGDSSLNASLELFEEGMGLIKNCSGALSNAEGKIKILTTNDGDMEDFEVKE